MRNRILQCLLAACCLCAAGCANLDAIAPGTAAAAVEASRGKPSRIWPEKDGGASWEYPLGPSGRTTYMVRVGADGRVTRAEQVLGWDNFIRITPGMPVEDVEHMLGRPFSKVTYPLTAQTTWSWRFVETVWYRCFLVNAGADGRVISTGTKDEETGDVGIVSASPC